MLASILMFVIPNGLTDQSNSNMQNANQIGLIAFRI